VGGRREPTDPHHRPGCIRRTGTKWRTRGTRVAARPGGAKASDARLRPRSAGDISRRREAATAAPITQIRSTRAPLAARPFCQLDRPRRSQFSVRHLPWDAL